MTKKRLASAFLTLCMILSLLPVSVFAATGNYKVEINVKKHPEILHNGISTLEVSFAVQSDDLYLRDYQSLMIGIDSDVDVLVYNKETGETKNYLDCTKEERGPHGENAIFRTYSAGEGPSAIKWEGEFFRGSLTFTLQAHCRTKTSCVNEIELVSVLVGVSQDYIEESILDDAVSAIVGNKEDLTYCNSDYPVAVLTDGFRNTRIYGKAETEVNTLSPAPELDRRGMDPNQTYTVAFDGGTGASGDAPVQEAPKAGDTFQFPENTFTNADQKMKFAGWSDGNQTYQPGETYTMPASERTFFAVWERQTAALESISISKAPTKTEYIAGENFNAAGMEITAAYSDETSKVVTGWTVTDGDALTVEDASVTVSYTEGDVTKTVTQPITVKPVPVTLESISVSQEPTKTEYIAGENFNAAGMEITAAYSDETSKVVTGWTVTDGDALTVEDASVTVSYTEGDVTKTVTQPITVTPAPVAVTLESISISQAPTKTEYVAGENFNAAGMEITAAYSDETSKVVTGWTVTDGDALTVEDTSVTVSYTEGDVTKTVTQPITVTPTPVAVTLESISISQAPTKTAYKVGENFDKTGMEVTATYSDGSSKVVTGWIVTDGEALTATAISVTVSYTEGDVTRTATQPISVAPIDASPNLVGIDITTEPTKKVYTEGESFDPTGMVVTATYSDNSSKAVTGWTVTDGENLTVEDTFVTVSYTESNLTITANQAITVVPVPEDVVLESIVVTQAPTKIEYVAGENFDPTGMVVTAVYSDGTSAEVTGWTVTDGENLTAEDTSVTVSYTADGVTKTTAQSITVKASEPPAQSWPIQAQFVKKGWFGGTTKMNVAPGGSIKAPNANGFFQSGNCWKSENGQLFVSSNGTVTYEQLLSVLGGTAQEGAVVRFVVAREQDRPVEPQPEPQTQIVVLSYQENGFEVGFAELKMPSSAKSVTSAQASKHLPQGYKLAKSGQNYTIVSGIATIPVVKKAGPEVPAENPITVTFQLSGWGQRLEGTRDRSRTITLKAGQSVTAPFVSSYFGRAKSVTWTGSNGLRVVSGEVVTYETLAQLLGGNVPQGATITFTNDR